MARYPYSPALKPPGAWSAMDFSDPKLAPGLRVLARQLGDQTARAAQALGPLCQAERVPARDGEGIGCYVFQPAEGCRGAVLYCHGGGFFLPLQPMMVTLAAQYAREAHVRVYLPEYRLLPEHPAPDPFRDCLGVLEWMLGREERYLLCGESAGGTLAAGLALYARDQGLPAPLGQLLIYPALDDRCGRYPSMGRYSQGAWSLKNNLTMWRAYLKNGPQGLEDYLVPMRAEDVSKLPPAYIEAQECDILHDEAVAYARRLEAAGVPVTLNTVPGGYHGFDADTENPFVQRVVRRRVDAMGAMLEERTMQ